MYTSFDDYPVWRIGSRDHDLEVIEREHSYIIHGPQPQKISSFTTYDGEDYVRIDTHTNIMHIIPTICWKTRNFDHVFNTNEKWIDGRAVHRRVVFGCYESSEQKVLMIPDNVYMGVLREGSRIWEFMRYYDIHWIILSRDLTVKTLRLMREEGLPRLHRVMIQCPINQMYLKDIVYSFRNYNEYKILVALVELQTLNLFPVQLPREIFLRLLCQLINRI